LDDSLKPTYLTPGADIGELPFLSALAQASLLRCRQISSVELVSTYLGRIEALNPGLRAYVTLAPELALDAAQSADQQYAKSDEVPPFLGVPISIKDNTETAGLRTTFSSRAFEDYVPTVDAAVVRRLRSTGFIVLGKTNTPEFGILPTTESELNGICRNPWSTDLSPGGSSGGAAVSVAAGLAPVAHSTDGGGSTRIPASCCGLVGLKPSRGRISWGPRHGEFLGLLAVNGFITRAVEDAAALLDIASGYEVGDPYWLPAAEPAFLEQAADQPVPLQIAVTAASPNGTRASSECVQAVESLGRLLVTLGHHVEEGTPTWQAADAVEAFRTVFSTVVAYYDADLDRVEPATRELAEAAASVSAAGYVRAVARLQRFARTVLEFWQRFDILLTPTLATPPVPVGWITPGVDTEVRRERTATFAPYTWVANVTGQPAINLPVAWSGTGLPIGVQAIGRPGQEGTLLRLAAQIQQAADWGDRRPPLPVKMDGT
jgi:amidase